LMNLVELSVGVCVVTGGRGLVLADEKGADNKITALDPTTKRVKEVIKWSSMLTAESRQYMNEYVEPEAFKKLQVKLQIADGAFIALIGLQGVGKSQALIQLFNYLSGLWQDKREGRVIYFKWPGGLNPVDEVFKILITNGFESQYRVLLACEIEDRARENPSKIRKLNRFFSRDPNAEVYESDFDRLYERIVNSTLPVEEFEALFFTNSEIRELRREFINETLVKMRAVLIDMRDYGKSDRRLFEADLMGIQRLWNQVLNYADVNGCVPFPNFVVAIQEELFFGSKGVTHFLLGKMETYEIKPLTPKELFDLYLRKFQDPAPFQPDALMKIAKLSRGVPRRFLRYINLCVDAFLLGLIGPPPIDISAVDKVVTEEELRKDLELEFSALFPKSDEMKAKALRLLSYLSAREERVNQKQLAEALGYSEMDVSRICEKLEQYGYIRRESTKEGKVVNVNA